jgi:hypothetical protein
VASVDDPGSSHRAYGLVLPLMLVAVVLMAAVPLFHPDDTCIDWLAEWGRQASSRTWVPIHQLATFGFVLAGAAVFFMPLLDARSAVGLAGSGALASGLLISALSYPLHATAISSLGKAFNHAATPEQRDMIKIMADSYIAYDSAIVGVSTLLISIGGALFVFHLWRRGAIGTIAMLVLIPLGGVWGAQRYHVFNLLGFSLPEAARWTCLCAWLAALAWLPIRRPALGPPA